MATIGVQGLMKDYISNIEFSLNFEDHKNSVKVKIGDIVQYNGVIAKYKKTTGEEITGKTSSLQSAINSNWLSENNNKKVSIGPINVKVEKVRNGVPTIHRDKISDHMLYQAPQFDQRRGGSFDTFVDNTMAKPATRVISEQDLVVKKMTISNEHAFVKTIGNPGSVQVSSSTSVPGKVEARKKFEVVRAEDYNAVSSTPMNFKSKTATTTTPASNSFKVDNTTPRLPTDATMKEVNRVTRPVVLDSQSQEGVVIRKINRKKMQIEEVEGITIKNSVGEPEPEIDVSAKVTSGQQEIDTSVTVSAGSTPVADLTQIKVSNTSYLDMLPENWAKLHWVKKEQFIKQLTDVTFIKFILTVEVTKAVQNACRKRLVELGKEELSGA